MSCICTFFADGMEEVEALTVVDLLRRADVDVTTVSIHERTEIVSAHGIRIHSDITFQEVADFQKFDMIFLPGGGKGTDNLEADERVKKVIRSFFDGEKKIAAICAAPRILGGMGLLKDRRATSYPTVMDLLRGAVVTENPVETDGNITTSRGVGTAVDMGLELIRILCGLDKAEEVRESIVYRKKIN